MNNAMVPPPSVKSAPKMCVSSQEPIAQAATAPIAPTTTTAASGMASDRSNASRAATNRVISTP